jgi:hypothetical protein
MASCDYQHDQKKKSRQVGLMQALHYVSEKHGRSQ